MDSISTAARVKGPTTGGVLPAYGDLLRRSQSASALLSYSPLLPDPMSLNRGSGETVLSFNHRLPLVPWRQSSSMCLAG